MEIEKRINLICFKVLSILPLFWILYLYSFTLLCSIKLGHFPIPSLNDPKGIGFDVLYEVVWFGFYLMSYGSLLCILNLFLSIYHRTISYKFLIIFGIGLSMVLLQLIIDPFEILFWYLD
jgi:hypothetical protein